jgi:hypothetical protein
VCFSENSPTTICFMLSPVFARTSRNQLRNTSKTPVRGIVQESCSRELEAVHHDAHVIERGLVDLDVVRNGRGVAPNDLTLTASRTSEASDDLRIARLDLRIEASPPTV